MANTFYTNNFKGRAGRLERAKHLVDEFKAIEDGFAALQAYNIATYLTIYTNLVQQGGVVTIHPDNGYLQEMTLDSYTEITLAPPLNESQYRVALLIHGPGVTIKNGWGAQTWKEYGSDQDNWWELFCGDGPYASMLLDFWWDICSHTWICAASSKNILNSAGGVAGTEYFYPLLCNLSNVSDTDTWVLSRGSNGNTIDQHQQYHYLHTDQARFHGVRWPENWCPTASDLTTLAWVPDNCTVTTDTGAGPASEDVQRLAFTATGGKVGCYIVPSFGRASSAADSIKVAVSFKCRGVAADTSLRVVAAFCGKTDQVPPVHDQASVSVDTVWRTYGCVLDITKEGNDPKSMALDQYSAKTLMEIAFMSPPDGMGNDIQVTDVQIEVLRGDDEEAVSEIQDTTIGSSIALVGTGTGAWDDGTKTLTLAIVGQSVDLSTNLEAGKTYLVHPRLQSGDAADIRMQNSVTVWAAGNPADSLYVQDAPFTFQYDGGELTFVLLDGVSSVYLVDIYEVSNNRSPYCYQNPNTIGDGYLVDTAITTIPFDSGILLGTAREIASTNEIPYQYFRTFTAWDQVGLSGIDVNDCRNPVFQSEYGIDGWPARATILQGASRITDGFIQRTWSLTPSTEGKDFQMWIRRSLDADGNEIYTPQSNNVTVPVSRYVDFEAELIGGATPIESGRVRVDLQTATFVGLPSGYNYQLGIFLWDNWYHIVITLQNDGTHDTFRVRVYPASADDPDPSIIDPTTQGWAVIDWAQFETTGGTFGGSSPIIGGYTRNTEDFTTALGDGGIYATYQDGSFLDEPNKKVADVVSNDIIWLTDDYVWRNLIYSGTGLGVATPYNMHEFGLVEAQLPPQSDLTIVTTTLYPVEVIDSLQSGATLSGGYLVQTPSDSLDSVQAVDAGWMKQTLLTMPTKDDALDTVQGVDAGWMKQILLDHTVDDAMDSVQALDDAYMESKLISALMPEDEMQTGCSLIGGTLS